MFPTGGADVVPSIAIRPGTSISSRPDRFGRLADQLRDGDHIAFRVGTLGNPNSLLCSLTRRAGDLSANFSCPLQRSIKIFHFKAKSSTGLVVSAARMQGDVGPCHRELAPIW